MDGATATQNRPRRFAPRRLLQTMGDERLVDHVRRGNDVAFEILYDRHHRGLLSFCRHMLGSREEAEDALQQTFLSAYRDLQNNEREIKVQAWLYTIARNRCLSVLRARRETASDDIELSTAGLADEVEQRADLRELLADMSQLPEQQRAALVLSEIGDLSHQEVATVVGVETAKVKSLVFQARTTLLESRDARDVSHEEIREQLSIPGATRRKEVKRHLAVCPSCTEYWGQVRQQRALLGVILPVVPTIALRDGVLAAVGVGGAGAGVAGATAVGGGVGGFTAAAGSIGAGKLAAVAIIVSGAVAGGGVVAEKDPEPKAAPLVSSKATPAGSSGGASGASALAAGDARRGERPDGRADRRRRKAAQRRSARRGSRGGSVSPGSPSAPTFASAPPSAQSSSAPRSSSPPASGDGGGSTPPPDSSGGSEPPPPPPPAEPAPPPTLRPGPQPCSNPVVVGPDGSLTPQPC